MFKRMILLIEALEMPLFDGPILSSVMACFVLRSLYVLGQWKECQY
jgi:hypothetical protein